MAVRGNRMMSFFGAPKLPFIIRIDTRNTASGSTASNQIKLPIGTGFSGNLKVDDWGDGTSSAITSSSDPNITHIYAAEGLYDVVMSGDMSTFSYRSTVNGGDKKKIVEIIQGGSFNSEAGREFFGCSNLLLIADDFSDWINKQVNLSWTFRQCGFSNLPDTVTMESATRVDVALYQCFNLITLPPLVKLSKVNNASNFLGGGSSIDTARCSQLLIDLEADNPFDNVTLGLGSSKYNLAGQVAFNQLVNNRGWNIISGGLE